MSLLLPVLLLGFAQPVDQPPASQQQIQIQTTDTATNPSDSANLTDRDHPRQVRKPFDGIEPLLDKQDGRTLCLTIRSYYFVHEDGLAPTFKGMTTCENARQVRNRNARKKLQGHLEVLK